MTLADKIVVLRDGKIERLEHRWSFTQSENLFVAGFIGSPKMNLLRRT